jgi:hypothetical protein
MYQGFLSHEVVELLNQQKKSFQIISPKFNPSGAVMTHSFFHGFHPRLLKLSSFRAGKPDIIPLNISQLRCSNCNLTRKIHKFGQSYKIVE